MGSEGSRENSLGRDGGTAILDLRERTVDYLPAEVNDQRGANRFKNRSSNIAYMFDQRNFQDRLVHNSVDKSIGLNPSKKLQSNLLGSVNNDRASGVPLYRREEHDYIAARGK